MCKACRGFLLGSSIGLLGFLFMVHIPVSHGAEYPTKTVQIINPFPPGAITDILARLLSDKVSSILGQSVVVINKSGGGGAVGIKAVKDAPADGYTILIAPPPIALIPLVRRSIGFALSDFGPLNLIGTTPAVMIVKAEAPWHSLEQFIADAKKKPGQLTFGTPGSGPAATLRWSCLRRRPASISSMFR